MLDHLIKGDYEPEVCPTPPGDLVRLDPTKESPSTVLNAQLSTTDWLEAQGLTAAHVEAAAAADVARAAFQSLTTVTPTAKQTEALLELKTPEAVRHLTGMLTAYDWEFVTQAKELRGFVVAKLIETATNAFKDSDRLKALVALGKITEVGLFTEKVEVKQTAQTDEELDSRIKEQLARMRGVMDALPRPAVEIEDASPRADQPDGG